MKIVTIQWETGNQKEEHKFKTQSEVDAFLLGIEIASGTSATMTKTIDGNWIVTLKN